MRISQTQQTSISGRSTRNRTTRAGYWTGKYSFCTTWRESFAQSPHFGEPQHHRTHWPTLAVVRHQPPEARDQRPIRIRLQCVGCSIQPNGPLLPDPGPGSFAGPSLAPAPDRLAIQVMRKLAYLGHIDPETKPCFWAT